jgi:hypothetical protein
LQHEPERDRIPSEVWRRLRVFKKQFEPTSLIKTVLEDEALLRSLVEQCTRRRGMARQRILGHVRRTFAGAVVKIVDGEILEISWLTPSPRVIANPKDHGERQQCTLVCVWDGSLERLFWRYREADEHFEG